MKSLSLLYFFFTNKQINANNLTFCFLGTFFWVPIPVNQYEICFGYGPRHWRVVQNLEELTRGLKNDMRNLINFHASSQKSENLLWWAPFVQSIQRFKWKRTEELCLMTLKSDAKFEEKLIFDSKDDMRNLVNFYVSRQVWKLALWYATFVNSI